METVVLDGVEYVKASVIAREFKYTSDYVGQLCRSRKIDARLVGRSWFVNPTSLRAHKKNKYQKSAAENTVQNGDTAHKIKIERKQVGPVIKNKTMKSLYDASLNMRQSQTGEKKLRVNYERDDEVLFPEITRKRTPAPRSLPIVPAGSKRLHISANKTNISFVAGELPDVALSGSLSVVGLEEPDKTTEEEKADLDRKIEQKAAKAIAKQHPQLKSIKTSVQADNNQKNKAITPFTSSTKKPRIVRVKTISPHLKKANQAIHHTSKQSDTAEIRALFKTDSVADKASSVTLSNRTETKTSKQETIDLSGKKHTKDLRISFSEPQQAQPVKISTAVLVSPLIATLLALVCVTVLLSASSSVTVTASEYRSELVLQMANLLELLH